MERLEAVKKAEELVSKMTVEEAASQLRFDAPGIERLGIPEYNWWNEALHGVARAGTATVFPQAIGLGATFDKELLKEIGETIALEGRAKYLAAVEQGDRDIYKGLTFWAPNINIFRDPRWGRGHETYGEDPLLTSELGVEFIKGLQRKTDDGFMMAAACAKHFAVHSGPEALRHEFNAEVNNKDLFETYLPAFEACVKEGEVEAVMGAYNRTNGEPCCGHKYLIDDILRKKWGFKGHVVSDCWAVKDFHDNHKVTKRPEESVKKALEAGCDLNCGCTFQKVMNAFNEGLLSEETIRQAAVRLMTTRYMLGILGEGSKMKVPYSLVECSKHLALSKKAALESIVLLKNDGILPVNKAKVKTIGVIGPNADSRRALMGNYYGTASHYVTPLEGIKKLAGEDIRVLYSEGAHLFMDKPDGLAKEYNRLAEAKMVAGESDLVILFLGLDETLEGEEGDAGNAYASGDKLDLKLPKCQLKLAEEIIKCGKPLVVCLLAGSAIDLAFADENAGAVLDCWYPGSEGGTAIAEVLFGKEVPGGKLPVTFYKDIKDLPEFTDYSMKGRTYRYFEGEVLYPFGYGLGYGKPEVEEAEVSGNDVSDCIRVKAKVKNTGVFPVNDVLQCYVKTDSPYECKNPRLVGFERIRLDVGEKKEVTIVIKNDKLCTVDNDGNKVLAGGKADIFIGFSSKNTVWDQTRKI
ncbi:MAG: glycoside hydrolase family 3 C-terminal domain-containing protein [Lachnospiraceae bacterium]|nr:glycoside hydrolase family 3 C-terminal domain-containing protein [Lachnospiraceae bacterium]